MVEKRIKYLKSKKNGHKYNIKPKVFFTYSLKDNKFYSNVVVQKKYKESFTNNYDLDRHSILGDNRRTKKALEKGQVHYVMDGNEFREWEKRFADVDAGSNEVVNKRTTKILTERALNDTKNISLIEARKKYLETKKNAGNGNKINPKVDIKYNYLYDQYITDIKLNEKNKK